MIPEISVQLYSVREQAAVDYEGTVRAIAGMGYELVEPAGFPGYTAAKAARLFQELGLRAPTMHCPLPVGDEKNRVIDEALLLGAEVIITGGPAGGKGNFVSAETVRIMAGLYCEAAEIAAAHGLQVGYHNHDWDLCDVEGRPGYRIFLERTPESVLWEADIFWVARAGRDPVQFLREIGARGKVLHFKDGIVNTQDAFTETQTESGPVMANETSPFLPAGTGQVDMPAAAKAATFAKYIVVELDSYTGDMLQAIRESYNYLTGQGIARGRKSQG